MHSFIGILSGILLVVIPAVGFSQATRKIKGEILSEENTPVPGLAVIQLGKQKGVATDVNGQFEMKVNEEKDVYIQLSGLDLEIYLKYNEGEEFKSVSLKDWKQIKKDNRRIFDEWKAKNLE